MPKKSRIDIELHSQDRTAKAVSSVEGRMKRMARVGSASLSRIADAAKVTAAGMGSLAASIGAVTVKYTSAATEMRELHRTSALTFRDFQTMRKLAETTGAEFEEIRDVTKDLFLGASEAHFDDEGMREAFDKLGIAFEDVNGKLLSNDVLLRNTIQRFSELGDSTEHSAHFAKIFGEQYRNVLHAFGGGVEQVRELEDAMEDLGLYVDREANERLVQHTQKWKALFQVVDKEGGRTFSQFVNTVNPILVDWAAAAIARIQGVISFETYSPAIKEWAEAVRNFKLEGLFGIDGLHDEIADLEEQIKETQALVDQAANAGYTQLADNHQAVLDILIDKLDEKRQAVEAVNTEFDLMWGATRNIATETERIKDNVETIAATTGTGGEIIPTTEAVPESDEDPDEKKKEKKEKKKRDLEKNYQRQRLSALSNFARASSGIAKEGSEEQKAIAVTGATVQGGVAILNAYRAGMETGGPWAPAVAAANMAAAIITTGQTIASINAETLPGGGGSTPATAPATAPAPQINSHISVQAGIDEIGQQVGGAVQAQVLEDYNRYG